MEKGLGKREFGKEQEKTSDGKQQNQQKGREDKIYWLFFLRDSSAKFRIR